MQSDLDRAKKMLFVCDFRACMNACTCGLCSSVRSKIFACTRFLFTCRGALDSCYFPRMPYACRFLDFRVRRFDNKLQVAFDRVQGHSPSGFWSGSRSGCNANPPPPPRRRHTTIGVLVLRALACACTVDLRCTWSGSGTRRVVRVVKIRCALYVLVLRSTFFYWFPGIREPPLATRLE